MKSNLSFGVLVLLFFFAFSSFAQHAGSVPGDSATILAHLQKMDKSHPRLLWKKGEEKEVLQKVENDELLRNVHKAILAECDNLLAVAPVERIQIGRRLLDKSRECLRRVMQLAYAYRTTKEEKYLKRAEKELLAVAAFSDWNPSHFLDVAEMTMAVAIGYDWLYDQLSPASRQALKSAMLTKGIKPSYDSRYNWFLTAEHNWNQVCNAGMIFGALALAEDEPALAAGTISRAIQTIPRAMEAYGPDGGYPEGFGYWGYGTSFNVLFISALEKALGSDFGLTKIKGFSETASFYQSMVGPTGMVHNWGDSGLSEGVSPAMFWFAGREKDPSLLWRQRSILMAKSNGKITGNRILPTLLIWSPEQKLETISAPKSNIWVGQGDSPVAMFRTSWTDPNAIFVGFKAGSASVNHAHMDIGSFVLDVQGERWAMDFGPQEYNSLEERGIKLFGRTQDAERWDIFRYNNLVHNTLTFNGACQQVKGYAKIDQWSEEPMNQSVVSDLSTVYADQVETIKRGIALKEQKYVVVRDEIKTKNKTTHLRWTLLTAASARIVDGSTVELSQNGKKMYLIFESQNPLTLKTWTTVPTHDYDAPNPGTQLIGFESDLPANSTQAFTVYFTSSKNIQKAEPLNEWKGKSKK
ncbi:heparinase II/III domain-containing protein [Arundinibacter roseus]|uniref:DUF4962 domain-containing protein n=1 Tax=Arundinibacter roseus TaxID=2070510 RepID=A0A4R4KES6_9BACT|nr:heparinase II/III family protein [Arundinibacter roseus]TDB65326.1 DUF4962 domain-containing protein [Arundinibacter roseus]